MEKEIQKVSVENFIKKEYKKLVNYVRKNMEERFFNASPEDIVQDVALNLFSSLDVNTQIENLTSYIYRSIKNKIIDVQRKKKPNISIETFNDRKGENALSKLIMDENDGEEFLLDYVKHGTLYEAIGELRPDEQALILATEFNGQTFDELSQEWEVPIGTLLSRKHRALSKLNKIITAKLKNDENN